MPRTFVCIVFFLILLPVVGCSSGIPSLYKIDIRQGNYVDQARVDELQPGMTKRQVQFLLGTPLIADPFHPQRWDYLYSFRPSGGEATEQRHITLFFDGDVLSRIEGDINPQSLSSR